MITPNGLSLQRRTARHQKAGGTLSHPSAAPLSTSARVTAADRPDEYRIALAVYLTACTRGPAPAIALGLARGDWLPEAVRDRLSDLESALRRAGSGTIADLVRSRRARGTRSASPRDAAPAPRVSGLRGARASPPGVAALRVGHRGTVETAEARRAAVLVDFDSTHTAPVQLSISTVQLRC